MKRSVRLRTASGEGRKEKRRPTSCGAGRKEARVRRTRYQVLCCPPGFPDGARLKPAEPRGRSGRKVAAPAGACGSADLGLVARLPLEIVDGPWLRRGGGAGVGCAAISASRAIQSGAAGLPSPSAAPRPPLPTGYNTALTLYIRPYEPERFISSHSSFALLTYSFPFLSAICPPPALSRAINPYVSPMAGAGGTRRCCGTARWDGVVVLILPSSHCLMCGTCIGDGLAASWFVRAGLCPTCDGRRHGSGLGGSFGHHQRRMRRRR
ncbi:hypothetical protein BDY21DRAFT_174502 [Lineolata rhizophorae]|uniref:Uncharacterized protein n=1 Tax=Lineolata rhizophorae TaxID=578093 RepID=A0A6A6NL13_9PEZI|nr:hypothetical protein BDY21DRAFT_174502 [Lineolata rhizophorae]